MPIDVWEMESSQRVVATHKALCQGLEAYHCAG